MSNQFCRHCGQTLESGVLFCTHCGYSVDVPAHSDEMRADAQLSAQPTQTMPSEKRKLRISIMPFLLGII
nr:zinc-ribbon domain-containing protein [Clostridia bacterium]